MNLSSNFLTCRNFIPWYSEGTTHPFGSERAENFLKDRVFLSLNLAQPLIKVFYFYSVLNLDKA